MLEGTRLDPDSAQFERRNGKRGGTVNPCYNRRRNPFEGSVERPHAPASSGSPPPRRHCVDAGICSRRDYARRNHYQNWIVTRTLFCFIQRAIAYYPTDILERGACGGGNAASNQSRRIAYGY